MRPLKHFIFKSYRRKQAILDSDVAMLYHYETKYINLAVRRNKERFPENFCFQLTENETENLRLQIATSSLEKENYGGRRTLPYVFTEQGIDTNKFHDRFIVIDNKELYHVGASLKDLGKKCFAISRIEDGEYIEKISNFLK